MTLAAMKEPAPSLAEVVPSAGPALVFAVAKERARTREAVEFMSGLSVTLHARR